MEISTRDTVAPRTGVVFRRLSKGRGGVLLKLDTGAYHSINETGAILWEGIQNGEPLDRAIDGLRRELDDSPEELESEVISFFRDLVARDLVLVTGQGKTTPPGV